jgi:molybdate transport system substrate-binding protein
VTLSAALVERHATPAVFVYNPLRSFQLVTGRGAERSDLAMNCLGAYCQIILLGLVVTGCHGGSTAREPYGNRGREDAAQNAEREPLRFAIAKDFVPAFTTVGEAFTKATGIPVLIDRGTSPDLADAILRGEPYDGFASAMPGEIERVLASGICEREPLVVFGVQRIAMWTRAGVEPPKRIADLADPRWTTIAFAPGSPYGKHATEAMKRAGMWDAVRDRIVSSNSHEETLRLARQSSVAIMALSLAIQTPGNYVEVDPSEYSVVTEQLVSCRGAHRRAREAAKQCVSFVGTDANRAILRRFGFFLAKE